MNSVRLEQQSISTAHKYGNERILAVYDDDDDGDGRSKYQVKYSSKQLECGSESNEDDPLALKGEQK